MIWGLIFYRYSICRTAQLFSEKIQIIFFADAMYPNAKNSTSTNAEWKSIASHTSPRYNCWVHNNNRTSIQMSSYKVKIIHALYSWLWNIIIYIGDHCMDRVFFWCAIRKWLIELKRQKHNFLYLVRFLTGMRTVKKLSSLL